MTNHQPIAVPDQIATATLCTLDEDGAVQVARMSDSIEGDHIALVVREPDGPAGESLQILSIAQARTLVASLEAMIADEMRSLRLVG